MRVLLDENVPVDLADLFAGHHADSVVRLGWAGVVNGELLRRAGREQYDVFVTMDTNLEHQQNVAKLPFGVLVLRAPSDRMPELRPLMPAALAAMSGIAPGAVVRVGPRPPLAPPPIRP